MSKITIEEKYMVVEREEGDPKFYGVKGGRGESRFLYWLKGILNRPPFELDLIKKRMVDDGHLMDEMQYYLRSRKIRKAKRYLMIYNPSWPIEGIERSFNEGQARAILAIERGYGGCR